MREVGIKWKDIAYILDMKVSAAQMLLTRHQDIEELGEKQVIKKPFFQTPVVLTIKQMARENRKMAFRDFPAELRKEFPENAIPSKSSIHRILSRAGFSNISLKK